MMKGKELARILSEMEGIDRKQMGKMAGGMVMFSVRDVTVARGNSDEDLSLDEDCIMCMLDMMSEECDLRDEYDYDIFKRLMDLMEG